MMCAIKRVNIVDDSLPLENRIAEVKSLEFQYVVSYYGTIKNGHELWVCLVALRHD